MSIKINSIKKSINGLIRGEDLCKLGEVQGADKLFLNVKGEIDIPVNQSDYIILKGDENFTVGQADIEDNPSLGKKIVIKLNGVDIEIEKAKIEGKDIRLKDQAIGSNSWLYADLDNLPDQKIEDSFTLIVVQGDCFITIPSADDGIIDIEECTNNDRKPPKQQSKYRIKIDGEKYIAKRSHLLGKEILALAGKEWQSFDLQQKLKGGKREVIGPEQKIDLSTKGVERFETVPKEAQQG